MYYYGFKDIKDESFRRKRVFQGLKFLLWPRKCSLTGRVLWLENAYKETAMWTGPGDPVFEHRWYDKHAYLIASLTEWQN